MRSRWKSGGIPGDAASLRRMLVLAISLSVLASACHGQMPGPPTFSTDSVVHGATFQKGAFAPNTFISIFGENLAWSTQSVSAANLLANSLPTSLGGVQVLIGPTLGFLVYVSPTQINVLIDNRLTPGAYTLRVLRDSLAGPHAAQITIAATAPGLFAIADGIPVVTRPDGSLVTPESPARPGQIVTLWATGLGPVLPPLKPGELPRGAAPLDQKVPFEVRVNGVPIPGGHILYAGVAPGFAGLYQINILLPEGTPPDPTIRVGYPDALSPAGQTISVAP
ncbi:MAG: hypothetical protein IT170_12125 [Bryobacterales bacterium]|nr:hypothetical protein [Bryobacterales bacterium]